MGRQYFSVPIFIIVLREVLETTIILSVLLALVEQIVKHTPADKTFTGQWLGGERTTTLAGAGEGTGEEFFGHSEEEKQKALIKRLRIQILAGTFVGLFIAICIGAAFLVVYYTTLNNIYGSAEELWEGIFSLIAMIMIFVMSLTMMRMDRAKVKWKVKLSRAFEAETHSVNPDSRAPTSIFAWLKNLVSRGGDRSSRSSKYILFFLPLVTVLREGLEAIVFVGGVSLGQEATSIPIAAIAGVIFALFIGYLIYGSSSRLNLSLFLIISTVFLMFIGAGLLAKAVNFFIQYQFNKQTGGDAAEAGAGPGSFSVDYGMIWHVDYGNPELKQGGWPIFSGIFGWSNTGYIPSVVMYCVFWLASAVALVSMKWQEGRCTIFGYASKARKAQYARRAEMATSNQASGSMVDYDNGNDVSPATDAASVKKGSDADAVQKLAY